MQFAFALENSFGPVAEYVRGLEAGLRTLGHDVAVVQDIAALPPGARPVLDGRLLPALPSERRAAFGQGAIALLHGPGATSHPADGRAQAALRAWLPRFERVVVTGSSAADRLAVELDVPRGRLAVVPPGVPEAPRSAGSGTARCNIVAVGALAPGAGHDVLLRALARLPDLDWSLTIAGDTAQDPAHAALLTEQARHLGLADRARIHLDPDPAALQAVWRDADVFALAARGDDCAGLVAEAVRRGLPVATTDGAAVPDGAGTATPVDDDAALSRCLRRVIFDAALRRAMADAAWQAGQALPGWPAQAALFLQQVR